MQPNNEQPTNSWSFHAEDSPELDNNNFAGSAPSPVVEPISWTGSEFLEQHKSPMWYLALAGFIALVSGVVFIVSRDYLSVGFIVVMGVLFGIIASRKPRQLQYVVDGQGIHIGSRTYLFSEFKSFSLQREGVMGYINLMPLKRLRPEISIYYPPDDEQRIFDTLSQRVPHEDHKLSMIDKLTRIIRF